MKVFSLEEVKRHNHKHDLWVVHDGMVADITPFAGKHPGGVELLLENQNGDVSTIMRSSPHKHSKAAYFILNKYIIGRLEGHPNNNKVENGVHSGAGEDPGFYDWSEDKLVNWSKPIFWQVGHLGNKYMDWCHQPVDREIRLFYSDFVEFFSKTKWWVIPLLWVPLLSMLLWSASSDLANESCELFSRFFITGFHVSPSTIPLFLLTGMVLWSFLEYVVHRWLFHMTPPSHSWFLITAHFVLHGQHHKSPFDHLRLVFPPVPAFAFAFIFYMAYLLVFPAPIAKLLLMGTGTGYVCYDLTHYYLHHGGTPVTKYFKNLKEYHNSHHFEHQMKGFGISSKLWDYPFQTLIPTKEHKKTS